MVLKMCNKGGKSKIVDMIDKVIGLGWFLREINVFLVLS